MKHLHVSNCALSELKHRSGCNGAFLLSHATVALVIRIQMSTKAQVHACTDTLCVYKHAGQTAEITHPWFAWRPVRAL